MPGINILAHSITRQIYSSLIKEIEKFANRNTSFWFMDCCLGEKRSGLLQLLPLTSISNSSWIFTGTGLFSLLTATTSSSSAFFTTTSRGSEEEEDEDDEEDDVEDEESESLNHTKSNH